jgi:hypothetical protein
MAVVALAAGLSLGAVAGVGQEKPAEKPAEKKGVLVEVQDQNNATVRFELQAVGPTHKKSEGVLRFTKKLAQTLDQVAWSEMPLGEDLDIKEIRIADAPLKFKGADGRQYLFYPVVVVPKQGYTASWLMQGEKLSGTLRRPGEEASPFSIPIADVKVVRFPS